MGTRMGPSYANLFVGYVEHQFCNQYNGSKPELYGRYIDDCIGAISSSREELKQFITSVNSFHPALKYTSVLGNFRNFIGFPRYQSFYQRQRFMYQCALQTYSFSQLFVVFIVTFITCQELHSLFSIS